jgi:hypothetical protein
MGRVCRRCKDRVGRDDEMILLEIEADGDGSTEWEREKRGGKGRAKRKNRWSAGEAEPRAGPGDGLEQQKRGM